MRVNMIRAAIVTGYDSNFILRFFNHRCAIRYTEWRVFEVGFCADGAFSYVWYALGGRKRNFLYGLECSCEKYRTGDFFVRVASTMCHVLDENLEC